MKTASTIKPRASLHAGMLNPGFNPGVLPRRAPLTFAQVAQDDRSAHPLPEVLRQVERLALALQAGLPATPQASQTAVQRRIGVTLRLDPTRHAQLRATASAQSRSAQKLLVEALDRYFAETTLPSAVAATAPAQERSDQPDPVLFRPFLTCTASTGNQP